MAAMVIALACRIVSVATLGLSHAAPEIRDELIRMGPSYHGLKSSRSWLPREPVVLTATGEELLGNRLLPLHWDWRNVNGRNFATSDVNQHIPQYCGACWIHGTVAQLNDRIKIMRNAAFPDVMVSRQALVNCIPGEENRTAGCFGGDPWMIYKYMHGRKVPDETCSPYKALNDKCVPWTMCGNCAPPPGFVAAMQAGKSTAGFDMKGGCYAVPRFTGYKVSQFGLVNGSEAMMKEIFARGPISCNLNSDDRFMYNYSEVVQEHEGVYLDEKKFNTTDHIVEVAGWGETASGLKYWVARNSWGTYWGQSGWFKIRRGVNQNMIEGDCSWAIPEFEDENLVDAGLILGDYVSGTHLVDTSLTQRRDTDVQISLQTVLTTAIVSALTSALLTVVVICQGLKRSSLHQPPLLLG